METTVQGWHPSQPYDDLPLLPPSGIELESRAVLKACVGARAALGELRHAARLIANESLLITLLPLLESRDSSEIENIVTTTDALFRHAVSEGAAGADAATREAARHAHALYDAFTSLKDKPISTVTAERICSAIKGTEMRVRHLPTALSGNRSGEVIYTPPQEESRLRGLLANWEDFMHGTDDIDPLVRMAVGHYQFEAIHPFSDGNGRTGRVINSLYLIEAGLLDKPVLYLSRYINRNRGEYYDLLDLVTRRRAWEDWTIYILRGVEQTARWTVDKITAITKLEKETGDFIRERLPKYHSHELTRALFHLPYCRIKSLVEADIAQRQTVATYLHHLAAVGVLAEVPVGREKLFLNLRFMELLERDDNGHQPFA